MFGFRAWGFSTLGFWFLFCDFWVLSFFAIDEVYTLFYFSHEYFFFEAECESTSTTHFALRTCTESLFMGFGPFISTKSSEFRGAG